MKIVSIFAEQLFAFQFEEEEQNELDRLLDLWGNMDYLFNFLEQKDLKDDVPKKQSKRQIVKHIAREAEAIDDWLDEILQDESRRLEEFFRPLHNQEYHQTIILSMQKGRRNVLRIYALKIDTNCFVITGGAIKFHHLMQDRAHTAKELKKIKRCRDYLRDKGVMDADSFYEFLMEER